MLAEVLRLDAWHKPLRTDGGTSSVYVELSFEEGRLGGDADLPFTFRVRLKRALLTIEVEEPLKIDRASIARPIPKSEVERKQLSSPKCNLAKRFRQRKG